MHPDSEPARKRGYRRRLASGTRPQTGRPTELRDGRAEPPSEPVLPDPGHIVVEPIEGAAQAFAAAVGGAVSALLPVAGHLFKKDGSLSAPAVFGLVIFALLIGWALLQVIGRARQREVLWEATRDRLTVHMDNIGPLLWDQVRAVEPVKARFGWLAGNPTVAVKVHLWMPMDVRRRMRPDRAVKFFVRAPVMGKNGRFLRLPLWRTKMREHGDQIVARLQDWQAGRP